MNKVKMFSPETLKMTKAVDNFCKLNFKESTFFIDHYQVIVILLILHLIIFRILFAYFSEIVKYIYK